MKILSTLTFCLVTLSACTPPSGTDQKAAVADNSTTRIRVNVVGTTAKPDPVETKIRALEKAGQLKVWSVRESFPLQFDIEGSAKAIAEVQGK